MSPAARLLLFLVRVYQTFFSALMPSACKFYPSCSHYAAEALRLHGARRGSWLALRRLLRCHPFTRGGVDLVPDAEEVPRRTGFSLSLFPCPSKTETPQAWSPRHSFALSEAEGPLACPQRTRRPTRHSTKEARS